MQPPPIDNALTDAEFAQFLEPIENIVIARISGSVGIEQAFSFEGIENGTEFPARESYRIEVLQTLRGAWAGAVISADPGSLHIGQNYLLYQKRLGGYNYYSLERATTCQLRTSITNWR